MTDTNWPEEPIGPFGPGPYPDPQESQQKADTFDQQFNYSASQTEGNYR